jgi:hypothetical protein
MHVRCRATQSCLGLTDDYMLINFFQLNRTDSSVAQVCFLCEQTIGLCGKGGAKPRPLASLALPWMRFCVSLQRSEQFRYLYTYNPNLSLLDCSLISVV